MVCLIFCRSYQVQSKLIVIHFIECLIHDCLVKVSLRTFIRQQSLQMFVMLGSDLLIPGIPVLPEQLIEKQAMLYSKYLLVEKFIILILVCFFDI